MSTDSHSVLSRYLEKVIQENSTIDARGVMQVNRMIALSMDDVFIHLTVRMKRSDERLSISNIIHGIEFENDSLPNFERKPIGRTPENIILKLNSLNCLDVEIEKGVSTEKLWQRSNNWALLGDPGAGKTTLLKHFALKAATACQAGKGHLPIFVPLRLLGKKLENHAHWLKQEHAVILNYVTQYGLPEMGFTSESDCESLRANFEQALSEGRALLLLDGLDEQRDAKTQKLTVNAIES